MESLPHILSNALNVPVSNLRYQVRTPLLHQSNRIYDVWTGKRRLIVKEFMKPEEEVPASLREFRALTLLSPLDVAPQPILYQPRQSAQLGPLVIYDYLPGRMWNRRRPDASELAELAELWLKIQTLSERCDWPSDDTGRTPEEIGAAFRLRFERYRAWAESRFKPAIQAADLCLEILLKRQAVAQELFQFHPPLLFCQSDVRFANIIRRPDGRLGLVDWEDSGLRDPARDLSGLLTHANQEDLLTSRDWSAFIEPYLRATAQSDPHLWHRTHLYLALWPLFWLSGLLQSAIRQADSGQESQRTVNEMPINTRLRRYLARAIAWPKTDFGNELEQLAALSFFPEE